MTSEKPVKTASIAQTMSPITKSASALERYKQKKTTRSKSIISKAVQYRKDIVT